MDLFVADDAAQRKPSRDGMNRLRAVGGFHVPSAAVKSLERDLDRLCAATDFPDGEEFKWSPGRKDWMRQNLQAAERQRFYLSCLQLAARAGITAVVVIADEKYKPATSPKASAEEDVVTMFLERAHNHLLSTRTGALVLVDQPTGGQKKEAEFLAGCLETVRSGTQWVIPERVALVLTSNSSNVRLLQLADLITSSTLALVGGEDTFSPPIFEAVKPLLRVEGGRIGGAGLKIHPDIIYANLYHWLLGDTHLWKGATGHPLPAANHPYAESPDRA